VAALYWVFLRAYAETEYKHCEVVEMDCALEHCAGQTPGDDLPQESDSQDVHFVGDYGEGSWSLEFVVADFEEEMSAEIARSHAHGVV
jgi:hypothetical protein